MVHPISSSKFMSDLRRYEHPLRRDMTTLSNLLVNPVDKPASCFSTEFGERMKRAAPSAAHLHSLMNNATLTSTQLILNSPSLMSTFFLAFDDAMRGVYTLHDSIKNELRKTETKLHKRKTETESAEDKTAKLKTHELIFLKDLINMWNQVVKDYGTLMKREFCPRDQKEVERVHQQEVKRGDIFVLDSDWKSLKKQLLDFLNHTIHLTEPIAARSTLQRLLQYQFPKDKKLAEIGQKADHIAQHLETLSKQVLQEIESGFINKLKGAHMRWADATNPPNLAVDEALNIKQYEANPADSANDYDINVIMLAEHSDDLNEKAIALSQRYPEKTILLDVNGKLLGADISRFTNGPFQLGLQSRVKLQILGVGRCEAPSTPYELGRQVTDRDDLEEQAGKAHEFDGQVGSVDEPPLADTSRDSNKHPSTTQDSPEQLTIGHYSAEQLGKLVPDLLSKHLNLTLNDKYLKTSFQTFAPDGTSQNGSLEENFANTYMNCLIKNGHASLVRNGVSIHTEPFTVDEKGRKHAISHTADNELEKAQLTGGREIGAKGGITGDIQTVKTTKKRSYSYTASSLEPLGETPAHYSEVDVIDYLKKMPDSKHTPHPDSLEICVIPKDIFDKWNTARHKGVTYLLAGAANYHEKPDRTVYAIHEKVKTETNCKFTFYTMSGSELTMLKPDDTRDLIQAAFSGKRRTFDVTIHGDGTNTLIDRKKGNLLSGMPANEWAEDLRELFEELDMNGKTVDHLLIRAPLAAGAYITTSNQVRANPVFPSDLATAMSKHGYVNVKTTIGATMMPGRESNPPSEIDNVWSVMTRLYLDEDFKNKLHTTPGVCWEDFETGDTTIRSFYLSKEGIKHRIGLLLGIEPAVRKLCESARPLCFQEILSVLKDKKNMVCKPEAVGGLFYYRFSPVREQTRKESKNTSPRKPGILSHRLVNENEATPLM